MKKEQILEYAVYGAGIYLIYRWIQNQVGTTTIGVPTGGGGNVSATGWTQAEAKKIADRLDVAMGDFGTDYSSMKNALTPLTGPQLVDVYNAFGYRNYIGVGYIFGMGAPLDLFGWFDKELDNQESKEMKDIWKKSNLTWAFS